MCCLGGGVLTPWKQIPSLREVGPLPQHVLFGWWSSYSLETDTNCLREVGPLPQHVLFGWWSSYSLETDTKSKGSWSSTTTCCLVGGVLTPWKQIPSLREVGPLPQHVLFGW